MSIDRDVTRAVRSWLHEDEHENADRVLDLVLDQVDTTPQRRAGWPAWRLPTMSRPIQIALAGAVILAAAFVGYRLFYQSNIGTQPTPSPTPVAFSELGGAIPPGPVILDGAFPLAIEFDVPLGWAGNASDELADEVDFNKVRGDVAPAWVSFSLIDNVYPDPCHPVGMDPPVGSTVDDLVNALTSMAGTEAGAVTDVQVDGHPGKRFDLETTVTPADRGCEDEVWLHLWRGTAGTDAMVPGPTKLRFTIVDVNGTRLVISTQYWDTDTATHRAEVAEADAVVDSVRFR